MNTNTVSVTNGQSSSSSERPVFQPKKLREQDVKLRQATRSLGTGDFGLNLGELLSEAYNEQNMPAPQPPVQKRVWSHSQSNGTISWKHWLFGEIDVEIVNMNVDDPRQKGSNSFVRVRPLSKLPHPSWVTLRFKARVGKNQDAAVHLLDIRGADAIDVTDKAIAPLSVSIIWNEPEVLGAPKIPHSRSKDKDNLDFVFVAANGQFVQIEVSLVTRAGRMWVCIQELYSGQVVRTTHAKARELELTNQHVGSHAALVAPLYPDNAFPGNDYLKSFTSVGTKVVEHAIARDAVVALSDCVVAKWKPEQSLVLPDKMRENGWQKATVAYFNLVVGSGNVLCEKDGQLCFVHFSRIIDETGRQVASKGDFPALLPMTEVAIKYREDKDRKSVV